MSSRSRSQNSLNQGGPRTPPPNRRPLVCPGAPRAIRHQLGINNIPVENENAQPVERVLFPENENDQPVERKLFFN